MAVHVVGEEGGQDYWDEVGDQQSVEMFRIAINEAETLAYNLHTEIESDDDPAEGILSTARDHNARIIVLGQPQDRGSTYHGGVVERVISGADCPVVVVRFAGSLTGGRILVPLAEPEDLDVVRPVVRAFGVVAERRITLLRLMAAECSAEELRRAEEEVRGWCVDRPMAGDLDVQATAAVSRAHRVIEVAREHDVLTMAMRPERGLRKALFGSLARKVADRIDRTTLLVYGSPQQGPPADRAEAMCETESSNAGCDESSEMASTA